MFVVFKNSLVMLFILYIHAHKLIWLRDTQQTNIVFTLRNRNLDTKATVQLENNLSIFIFPWHLIKAY